MDPGLAIATLLQTSRDFNGVENDQTGYVFPHARLGLRRPERANGLLSAALSPEEGEGHKWDFANRNPLPFAKAWRGLKSQSLLPMSQP